MMGSGKMEYGKESSLIGGGRERGIREVEGGDLMTVVVMVDIGKGP